MTNILKPKQVYWLRWKFEYNDNKATVTGIWNNHGPLPNRAWNKSKENLAFAIIEAKDLVTNLESKVVVVDGHEFCNFEWIARQHWKSKESQIIGLQIRTRKEIIKVYCNKKIEKISRPIDDLDFHYVGFGK